MSEPNNNPPLPDWTPEQKAAILAKFKKQFTVEKLIEYIEDDDEKFPAEQVLVEVEEMVRRAKLPPETE
jgi:hypothetical protein